jgi:predicted metal-dependent peptidase
MLTGYFGNKSSLTQDAKDKVAEFRERKSRYLKEKWVKEAIDIVRKHILLQASMGETSYSFRLDEHISQLSPLSFQVEDLKAEYEIDRKDKDYILTEVVKHYSDEEMYPELYVKPSQTYIPMIQFQWE